MTNKPSDDPVLDRELRDTFRKAASLAKRAELQLVLDVLRNLTPAEAASKDSK